MQEMEETIVLYPLPGIGHLISMVELGKSILGRRHLAVIHILIPAGLDDSPSIASYLSHVSRAIPSIIFHHLPFLHVRTSPSLSFLATAFDFVRLNTASVHRILEQILRGSRVLALVVDFFGASTVPVSQSLGIPVFFFFTSGLAALSAYLSFPGFHKQIDSSFKDLLDLQLHIPGLPPLPAKHMPQPVLDRNDPAYYDVLFCSHHLANCSGIIVNTFDELEPDTMKALKRCSCPTIYNIGPLVSDTDTSITPAVESCLSWLDSQPKESVVFLCFGSRGVFSANQLKEMAKGLEISGQRFLWAVRKPHEEEEGGFSSVAGMLPEGFLGRTEGKGMVVESWVPQKAVLKHAAVAGFVTHCGWNSVLEAAVSGVPMLAWPLYAEQRLNRAVLVEQMKMAIAVEEREDGFVVGEEVGKKVRELMDREKSGAMRERCGRMRSMACEAWVELGSSTVALSEAVRVWLGKR